jgi:hypothetical protein
MPLADIRPALREWLLTNSNIAAVVGTRIYPVILGQGATDPSIVYNLISELNDHHMEGPSGLVMVRMQIDAYAQLHDDAAELANLVKEALDGYSGLMGTVQVQGVFADTARTDYQSDPNLHRVSRDYLIHFDER